MMRMVNDPPKRILSLVLALFVVGFALGLLGIAYVFHDMGPLHGAGTPRSEPGAALVVIFASGIVPAMIWSGAHIMGPTATTQVFAIVAAVLIPSVHAFLAIVVLLPFAKYMDVTAIIGLIVEAGVVIFVCYRLWEKARTPNPQIESDAPR